MARRTATAELVLPGLWNTLWENKIKDFEHDPRLLEVPEVDREATRLRWTASATKAFKGRGFGTPRERRDAGEPFVFPRYLLRGNEFIPAHPLASDRSIRWLTVDHDDVVTASEDGP